MRKKIGFIISIFAFLVMLMVGIVLDIETISTKESTKYVAIPPVKLPPVPPPSNRQ